MSKLKNPVRVTLKSLEDLLKTGNPELELDRPDFDVLKPPQKGGGGEGGESPKGVMPWPPPEGGDQGQGEGEGESGEGQGEGEGKGQGQGKDQKGEEKKGQGQGQGQDKGDKEKGQGKGQGKEGIKEIKLETEEVPGGNIEIVKNPGGLGGILTSEESRDLQKALGVPIEEAPSDAKIEEIARRAVESLPKRDKSYSRSGGGGKNMSLRDYLLNRLRPQVDWRKALKDFIGKALGNKIENYVGNRRFIHQGDYYSAERRMENVMKSCVCAIDISGSMGDEEVATILTEVKGIVEAKKIKETVLVYFHTAIALVRTLKTPGAVKKYEGERPGSGGTDFIPPLEYMNKAWKDGKMELGVFLTDGFADLDLPVPKFKDKFIWVILDNPSFEPPFGKMTVYINSKDIKPKK